MADYTSTTENWETVLTTTHDAILSSGVVHDNVFNAAPLSKWLRGGSRMKILQGGADLREGLMYGKNSTSGWYSGYGTIAVTPLAA